MSRRGETVHLTEESRDMFAWRLTQDAWAEATQVYWERRARQLEAARPRPGDFTGRATRAERLACWDRLTEAAAACRARGRMHGLSRLEAEQALADLRTGTAA